MRIRWHGHSCFEITDDMTVVTDPHDGHSIGIRKPSAQADVILVSHEHYDHNSVRTVDKPGSRIIMKPCQKNVGEMRIRGFPAFHDESGGAQRGEVTLFKFNVDGVEFLHLGDLGHRLDEDTLKKIGHVDILFVPVGGIYTLDAQGAWNVIREIKPKVAIPMHYKIGGLSLPIGTIDDFTSCAPDKEAVVRVGNEVELCKDDLPESETEIWVFTL